MKLGVAHIHGIDFGRAVLKQTVGEPSGGSSGIQTDKSRNVQPEILNGRQQLVRSPAHKAFHSVQNKARIGAKLAPRLVHRGKGASRGFILFRRSEENLARHDQAMGLFATFRQALAEDQIVSPAFVACRWGKGAGNALFRHGILRTAAYMTLSWMITADRAGDKFERLRALLQHAD